MRWKFVTLVVFWILRAWEKIRRGRYGWNSDNESMKMESPSLLKIEITSKTLSEVKENFDNNERQIDLAVDENHEPNHKALARYRELYLKDNKNSLFAKLELTQKGADLLNEWAYKYFFSPEIVFKNKTKKAERLCQICWSVELSQTALLQSNETIACVRRKRRSCQQSPKKSSRELFRYFNL